MRVRVVTPLAAALVLAILGAVVLVVLMLRGDDSPLERALQSVPVESDRVVFTDWSQVRDELGPPGETDLLTYIDEAYAADLSRLSAFEDRVDVLDQVLGFPIVEADWEIFAQSTSGAAAVVSMSDVDLEAFADDLERSGYTREGDLYSATVDQLAGLSPLLTPLEQVVVVRPDDGLVVLSDTVDYAQATLRVIDGEAASAADDLGGVAERLSDPPASALLLARDNACAVIGFANASDEDRTAAEEQIAGAGGISPVQGFAIARDRSQVEVVLGFADSDQAESDLQPRTDLARGEAVGLGGTFAERFEVEEAERRGSEIVLTLDPADGEDSVFSVLARGPLLFASC